MPSSSKALNVLLRYVLPTNRTNSILTNSEVRRRRDGSPFVHGRDLVRISHRKKSLKGESDRSTFRRTQNVETSRLPVGLVRNRPEAPQK